MGRMMYGVDEEMEILCTWNLTADEWLLVRLLFLAKNEGEIEMFKRYYNTCLKTATPLELLTSLQKKKILSKETKFEKGQTFTLADIEFDEAFEKRYFKKSMDGIEGILDNYPEFLSIGGKLVPIKGYIKYFKSKEDLARTYAKSIKHDAILHEKVLESLQFAKDNRLINYTIAEYIASEQWKGHIKMMESGQIGNFVTTFDTMTS